jgi:hypothetical protein
MRTVAIKSILLAICAAIPPIVVWSISYNEVAAVAVAGNYYFAATIFLSFLAVVCVEFAAAHPVDWKTWLKTRRTGLIVAVILGIFLQVGEPHIRKIMYDEDLICGVAREMHDTRQAAFPARAHIYDGNLVVLNFSVDKRPVFYPFVLCTVHDLTGYRRANVFILNGLCAAGLLFLIYLWARPLAGEWGAVASMLLFTTMPLLAQNATGAGFEVMNLLLIVAFALAARRYLEKRGTRGLDLMIAVALMLSITRYESVLYLFALVAVVLFKWIRERRVTMTYFSAFSPLLLFSFFLSNRSFIGNDGFMQRHNDAAFVSISNLAGNLERAAYYLLDPPTGMMTNSLFLSIVGFFAITLFLVYVLLKIIRRQTLNETTVVLLAVLSIALATTLIGLLENWGQWDDPMAARFCLPFHLLMVMCFAAALANSDFYKKYRMGAMAVVVIPACWIVIFTSSQNASHHMTSVMPAAHASAFFRGWADKNATERDLLVGESSIGFIVDNHPSVAFISANMAPWKLKAVLNAGLYDHVYVMQRLRMDPAGSGKWIAYTETEPLSSTVVLKTIAESRPRSDYVDRISEVVDVEGAKPEDVDPSKNMEHYNDWLAKILP